MWLLLDEEANINATDESGRTSLQRAAASRREAVVQLLLDFKADVSAKDMDGRTALSLACSTTIPSSSICSKRRDPFI